MPVSLWAVLGLVLLLLGLPLGYIYSWGDYLVGAGVAFLVVAISDWAWSRWTESPVDDEDVGESPPVGS